MNALHHWLADVCTAVEGVLSERFLDAWPPALKEAIRYPLFTGGKRVRPALCVGMYQAIHGHISFPKPLLAVAASVEMIHTYSLVHDDLPCLDNDDERRGVPTVHRAFGEGPALLVGDALLTEAFTLLAEQPLPSEVIVQLVTDLSTAAGYRGMIGGQGADIGMNGPVVDHKTLSRLHRLKTGALLQISAVMGARVAQATPEQLAQASAYGQAIGLAFQLADDVLDAEEDQKEDGPPSFVKLLGVDETRRQAEDLRKNACEAIASFEEPQRLLELAQFITQRDH